jgi:hypothetical protein
MTCSSFLEAHEQATALASVAHSEALAWEDFLDDLLEEE